MPFQRSGGRDGQGRRLTVVRCGFKSRPDLQNTYRHPFGM